MYFGITTQCTDLAIKERTMGCMGNRHNALILGNNLDGTTVDGELNTIHSLKGLGINAVCVRKKGKTASAVQSKL